MADVITEVIWQQDEKGRSKEDDNRDPLVMKDDDKRGGAMIDTEKVSEAPPPPDVTSPPPRIGGNDTEVVPPVRTCGVEKADEEVERQRRNQGRKEEGRARKPCSYMKGGVCRIHGKGAVSKWRPVFKTVVGEGGR